MFWDLNQQMQIEQTRMESIGASSRIEANRLDLEGKIKDLHDRIETLTVACQAMWELLSEQTNIGESRLARKIEEVDLRAGATVNCARCGRPNNSRRHQTCLYCGYDINSGKNRGAFGP